MDALDETIEACESAGEWAEEAERTLSLGAMDLDAEQFLEARCEESDLAQTALCEDL